MKKFYIYVIVLLVVNNAVAQWEPMISGTTNNLHSVYFTDVNTGYAVGDSGIILKTTNGGIGWIQQNSGITDNLYSVFFTSLNTGYAVGGSVQQFGFILKTINGGANWSLVHTSDTIIGGIECAFNSVYFTDINTGYVVGGYSDAFGLHPLICKTTDGGINWTSQSSGLEIILNSVHFPVADTGYAVGGDWGTTLNCSLKTNDGGASWELLPIECQNLTSVFFTTKETGFVTGEGSQGDGGVAKTTDGGANWFWLYISWNLHAQYSIYFTDANTGYSVGSGIWKTTDGGSSWSQQFVNGGNYGINRSVYFPVSDTGYIVGWNGAILKTTNGGGYVGVNDHHQTLTTLNIYPNPASDKITIETSEISQKSYLSVYNLNGQEIIKQNISETKTTIDISNLNAGLCIVKVVDAWGVRVGKIIKE